MAHICEFCECKFADTSALGLHIRTAKKCLATRGLPSGLPCKLCGSSFATQRNLERHLNSKACLNKQAKKEVDVNISREQYDEYLKLKKMFLIPRPVIPNSDLKIFSDEYKQKMFNLLSVNDLTDNGVGIGLFFREKFDGYFTTLEDRILYRGSDQKLHKMYKNHFVASLLYSGTPKLREFIDNEKLFPYIETLMYIADSYIPMSITTDSLNPIQLKRYLDADFTCRNIIAHMI